MNTLDLANLLERSFHWAWNASLSASILALIVLTLRRVLRFPLHPKWCYALWLLVLFRLMIPITPPSPTSVLNLGSRRSSPADTTSPAPPAFTRPDLGNEPIPVAPPPAAEQPRPGPTDSSAGSSFARLESLLPLVWAAGLLVFLAIAIGQLWRFKRWLRHQPPLRDHPATRLLEEARVGSKLRKPVEIIASNEITVPAVFGVWRPRLLLPRHLLDDLDSDELRLVFLHELTHIKRRDVFLNWIIITVRSMHWFNPVVWFALRQLRVERELVRDSEVLSQLPASQRRLYGATLIKLLGFPSIPCSHPGLVLFINKNKQDIQRRINMISTLKPHRRLTSAVLSCLFAGLICLTFTKAADRERQPGTQDPRPAPAPAENHDRNLRVLQEKLRSLDDRIHAQERELQALSAELDIPSYLVRAPDSSSGPAAEKLKTLHAMRTETEAEFARAKTMLDKLRDLDGEELKVIIPSIVPDTQLSALNGKLAAEEQKLAVLSQSHAEGHPEIQQLQQSSVTLQRQISARISELIAGIQTKVELAESTRERLSAMIEEARQKDRAAAADHRRLTHAQRDLDNLLNMRDQLMLRIFETDINAALQRARTEPAAKPTPIEN